MEFHVSFPLLNLEFNLNRVAFEIFGFEIYWYAILIATGMLIALLFAFSNAKRFGVNSDRMIDVIVLSTICAVICGRLYFVVFSGIKYQTFFDVMNIRDGGIGIYGGIIGAFVTGILFCKLRKVKTLPMFDIAAIGFLIGQGMGRWGNFVNQEAFGSNTNSIFGMISSGTTTYLTLMQDSLAAQGIFVDPNMPVHPTFLYESIWCFIGVGLLWWYSYHRKFDGEITLMYMAWYGTGRFIIEGLRTDSLMIGDFRVSQLVALVLVISAIVLWLYFYNFAKKKIKNNEKTLWVDILKENGEEDMGAKIIDGKVWAQTTKDEVKQQVLELNEKGISPKLTVFIVGENPASKVYVAGKAKDCEECGIASDVIRLPQDTTEQDLLNQINDCNNDKNVSGILVQLPLPDHIDDTKVIEAISPEKDVDGFTAINVGKMMIGEDCFLPCTPAGCIRLIETTGIDISGKDAVVIGRSNIVGKPAAMLLTQKNATVTICHSKTQDLKKKCAQADIIVAAIGKANFVTKDMVKKGAVVIDVGINRLDNGKLCGDVDFANVSKKAGHITPVPGGVGLMTRAMLMVNTVKACKNANNIK